MTLPSFLAVHILIASLHEVLGKKKRKNDKKKERLERKKEETPLYKRRARLRVSFPRDAERSRINGQSKVTRCGDDA